MAEFTTRKATGVWVVRASGAVIAESANAIELSENGLPEVIYFPREDVGMEFLEATETSSVCPDKGTASYYSVVAPEGTIADAAWSYETPKEGAEAIAGHLAFYSDKVTVEEL